MRPAKLTLEGFTSFAERTEIDFTQLDLFAITGPTGSGKTSILDAITWALYGKTARLGKTAVDLISHGVARMTVILEFTVGAERYQVARTARRTGSPQLRLEQFHETWIPTDHTTASEINDAIVRIVGLDFDAFTRSVILPQGKFDAFLRGEAKDRREILKSLLGLDVYDRMREAAVKHRTALDADIEARQRSLEREFANVSDEALAALKAQQKDMRKRQKENKSACEQAQSLAAIAADLRARRDELQARTQDHAAAELDHGRAVAAVSKNSQEVGRLNQAIAEAEKKLAAIAFDEPRFEQLLALTERAKRLTALQNAEAATQQEITSLQQAIGAEAGKLAAERASVRKLEDARLQAERDLTAARAQLAERHSQGSADLLDSFARALEKLPTRQLAQLEQDRAAVASEDTDLRKQIEQHTAALTSAEAELQSARTALDLLNHQNAHTALRAGLKPGDPCPVCEQIVTIVPKVPAVTELKSARLRTEKADQHRQSVNNTRASSQAKLEALPARLRDLDTRILDTSQAIEDTRRRAWAVTGSLPDADCIRALTESANSLRAAEANVKTLEQAHAKTDQLARASTRTLAALETESTKLNERLAARQAELTRTLADLNSLAPEIEAAGGAARIDAERAAAVAAKQARATLTQAIAALNLHQRQACELESAAKLKAAGLQGRIRAAADALAALNATLTALNHDWARAVAGVELPPGADEHARAAAHLRQLEDDRVQIATGLALTEAAIETTRAKLKQLGELNLALNDIRAQRTLYEQIAQALRADRFIAYLLEAAYDDLCAKGSDHLRRLSQERYTFAPGKSEFHVIDAFHGDAERSSATLSGGESFLASLALALALADSVATLGPEGVRAARLETLFIDEGVSSLDDETLSQVVEALGALETEDRLVGIISHMENLAERLPTRLDITKQKGRSKVGQAVSPARSF